MSDVLAEQRRYYAERAPEYDDWWFRRGRFALDPEPLARWESDVAEAESALEAFRPRGRVLELAAGTGLWTRHLVRHADRLVAVDASPQTLEVNRARVEGRVEYVVADLFAWEPEQNFDLVFFSFWLSHVPEERFDAFWQTVRTALAPGGRVFLVDSGAGDTAHTGTDQADEHETRSLSDGRTFRIVKRRWPPDELADRVRPLGFELELRDTANAHFLLGGGGLA
jgi:demethylmenaquinone methyltransferase/2-methoxy-6-polyprenyl-1,4-benzoquinol methylase